MIAFFQTQSSSSSKNSDLRDSLQIGHEIGFASSPGGTTTYRARNSASRLAASAATLALELERPEESARLFPLLSSE